MFDTLPISRDSAVYVVVILTILIAGAIAISGGSFTPSTTETNPPNVTPVAVNVTDTKTGTDSAKKNLQLYTFTPAPTQKVVSLLPTPANPKTCGVGALMYGKDSNGNCCVEDGSVTDASQCCPGVPTCQDIQNAPNGVINGNHYSCEGIPNAATWCDAKPVIYLYPTHRTTVSVKLRVPGSITTSIPHYPTNGWEDITAYPDGRLMYQGKTYNELFYEASVTPIDPPAKGFVVPTGSLRETLLTLTGRLGLNIQEQHEFIAYWLPRLNNLKTPYVFISLFDPTTKDTIDHVEILPRPDTFIQYIFYFKGLTTWKTVQPLALPDVPQRQGFTAVEWGGIIDY